MNIGGMIFMALSWGLILFLSAICFIRMIKTGNSESTGNNDMPD